MASDIIMIMANKFYCNNHYMKKGIEATVLFLTDLLHEQIKRVNAKVGQTSIA